MGPIILAAPLVEQSEQSSFGTETRTYHLGGDWPNQYVRFPATHADNHATNAGYTSTTTGQVYEILYESCTGSVIVASRMESMAGPAHSEASQGRRV